MNKDLTVGKPETVLWKFCLPLFGSIVFQQLYNIADSLIAGKFVGEKALAAVGNSYEITLIFIAFAFGCNIGCSVVVSQFFGAKKFKDMKAAVYTTFISSAVLCAVLMLFGILCCDNLLALIHTPAEIFDDSKLYLDIYVWGLPFLFFYNIATGAWATFLCQGISCVLAIVVVLKRLAGIHVEEKIPIFSFDVFKKIVVIAVPSILQQSFISIGNIVIQSVINGFGSGVIAGYSAAIKLNNLVITSFTTLANGVSNYAAQNIGAGIMPRVKDGFKAGVKMVWMICIPIVLLYLTAGRVLVNFFMNEPTELALASGTKFLYIVAPFYFVVSVKLVADGILRGGGLMKNFMIATFTDLILRVVLAKVLAPQVGYIGIWCAWPIGWSVATVLSVRFYGKGPWKKDKKLIV